MTIEDRIVRATAKLRAVSHLLSQYKGDVTCPDEAFYGLSLLIAEIDQELAPIKGAPADVLNWELEETGGGR